MNNKQTEIKNRMMDLINEGHGEIKENGNETILTVSTGDINGEGFEMIIDSDKVKNFIYWEDGNCQNIRPNYTRIAADLLEEVEWGLTSKRHHLAKSILRNIKW